jgi:hypothetical protein
MIVPDQRIGSGLPLKIFYPQASSIDSAIGVISAELDDEQACGWPGRSSEDDLRQVDSVGIGGRFEHYVESRNAAAILQWRIPFASNVAR